MQLLAGVDVIHVPELIALLEPGEELAGLLKLSAEKLLLRWLNHHLEAAGSPLRVSNFGEHVKDCAAYDALIRQLLRDDDAASAALEALPAAQGEARAAALLRNADLLLAGAARYVRPADILGGNAKLNLAFVATLFNARHGLVMPAERELADPAAELAGLLDAAAGDDDSADGREARVLRCWANSLGLESPCEDVVADAADGAFLLSLLDKLAPGAVDWRRVAKPPFKLPFRKLENLNLAVRTAAAPPFNAVLVGVDGKDLMDGRAKLTLGLCYQLMRFHQLATLQGLACGARGALPSDAEVIALANGRVAAAGKSARMASFKDASLADGRFFLELLAAQGARVAWELVSAEATDAAREANAKYVISVARRAGACIFNSWVRCTGVRGRCELSMADVLFT